jgi:hypothetical protein
MKENISEALNQMQQTLNSFARQMELLDKDTDGNYLDKEVAAVWLNLMKDYQNMKTVVWKNYYEQQKEVLTLQRMIDVAGESEINIYQKQQTTYNESRIVIEHNDTPIFIRLGKYILPLKKFNGLNTETDVAKFGKDFYQLSKQAATHLKSVLYPYLAQRKETKVHKLYSGNEISLTNYQKQLNQKNG